MYYIPLPIRNSVFIALLAALSFACNMGKHTDEKPVARVYDMYLYPSDLRDIIPVTASAEDSTRIADQYIKNWTHEKVLLKQAELNLSEDQLDFKEKLEQYKNSLIIYAYEQALVNEKLDTSVSMQAMLNYYEKNKHNFIMSKPAYKLRYVRVMKGDPELKQLRKWISSNKIEDIDELQVYCEAHGLSYFLNDSVWVRPETIHSEIPPQEEMNFYKNPGVGLFELSDDRNVYLIFVLSVLKQGEQAPFELVKPEVRNLILNVRKRNLLKKMRQDIYNEALQKKEIEIKP